MAVMLNKQPIKIDIFVVVQNIAAIAIYEGPSSIVHGSNISSYHYWGRENVTHQLMNLSFWSLSKKHHLSMSQ